MHKIMKEPPSASEEAIAAPDMPKCCMNIRK